MSVERVLPLVFLVLVGCGRGDGGDTAPSAADDTGGADDTGSTVPRRDLSLTRVGDPSWEVADTALWVGRIGHLADGFPEYFTTGTDVFPHHAWVGGVLDSAGEHEGYATELADGLTAAGFDREGPVTTGDLRAPSGWLLAWVIVPGEGARIGDTPDAEGVPLLRVGDALPVTFDGDLLLDGSVVDPYFDGSLFPSVTPDGASHLAHLVGENDEAAGFELAAGAYTFTLGLRDPRGAGWDVEMGFDVE